MKTSYASIRRMRPDETELLRAAALQQGIGLKLMKKQKGG